MGIIHGKETVNSINMNDVAVELDEASLRALQRVLLDMYKDILRVCSKYHIIPYLIGGSALGAIRHQGFIPWDDDLDIGMTRSDYQKFRSVFNRELSDQYILNAPNRSKDPIARFPKVLKKNTRMTGIGGTKIDRYQCVFVDIFILENVPENAAHRKLKGFFCNAMEYISGTVFDHENWSEDLDLLYRRTGYSNYLLRKLIGTVFSLVPSARWFSLIDRHVQYRGKSALFGIPTGRKHYFGEILKKKEILPETEVPFEDIKAPVFQGYDRYLTNLYGDYMEIPPVEKRERHLKKKLDLEKH